MSSRVFAEFRMLYSQTLPGDEEEANWFSRPRVSAIIETFYAVDEDGDNFWSRHELLNFAQANLTTAFADRVLAFHGIPHLNGRYLVSLL